MKLFLPFLLVCLALGKSNLELLREKRKLAQAVSIVDYLTKVNERKEKLRKLQETDTTDGEPANPLEEGPKNISASEVTVDTPKDTTNTSASYQIKKFYNFICEKSAVKFYFSMFFYFLKSKIAKRIRMKLKILFSFSRMRNLQSDNAQSVTTECNIKPDYASKASITTTSGENIDYTCEAPKPKDAMVTTVNLDTKSPIQFDDEDPIDFSNVSFEPSAAEDAKNIANVPNITVAGVLDKSSLSEDFTFTGTPISSNFLESYVGQEIPLKIVNYPDGEGTTKTEPNTYDCTVKSTSSIQCKGSISTTAEEISKATSTNNDVFLKINMADSKFVTASNAGSGNVYRKSSSGLSGGAIAGIVIACVVVLVAASVAAIMLRKPTPPIDNTTVANLQTENI